MNVYRAPGIPRYRWLGNSKMNFEIAWGGTDWIDLVHDRNQWRTLTSKVISLLASIKFGNS
jgi:hypothetical protein